MNRRRLLMTALGALAGCLGLPKVVMAAVERKVTPMPIKKPPLAELFVSVSADVNAAISGLVGAESRLTDTPARMRSIAQPVRMYAPGVPLVRVGSLLINSEEEAAAFLKSMADAIYKAKQRGTWSP